MRKFQEIRNEKHYGNKIVSSDRIFYKKWQGILEISPVCIYQPDV
jgi:hypothetical protein